MIDLSAAIGGRRTPEPENCFVVISEFNRTVQGFLVSSVERIVNVHWESILPPPEGAGKSNYLTAVTNIDNELVEIIDVEKILAEIAPVDEQMSAETRSRNSGSGAGSRRRNRSAHSHCR